jgi:hypothetical protein
MRPLVLTAATGVVLAFIRRTTFPLSVYRRSAARVYITRTENLGITVRLG